MFGYFNLEIRAEILPSFLPSIDIPLTVNNYFENSYFCSFCMPIFSPYFIWSHLILKIPHLKQQDIFC